MLQETRFQELKRDVRFDARDAELLLAFRGLAAPEFPRIAQEFYERIREHADAHEVFADEEQIQRLQRSLVLWMARIFGGVYDETYYEQPCQIGRVHVRIGLPQRFTLTAMALIRIALLRIADSGLHEHAAPTREAVSRIWISSWPSCSRPIRIRSSSAFARSSARVASGSATRWLARSGAV